ncbi:MAG: sigma 54-interacting transcriptional regulator [Deltaproteobacteria bacterium]|nr:sigma 54-interacting transcriptional regulator [Deltaproteobacteria bacterium]MBT6488674.1 sigma 54-interacting transcriptional regulator [Deltaproteobacteria bacterium]
MRVGVELESAGRTVMWRPLEGALMTIGQNPECDLCIPQEELGMVHCVLQWNGEVLSVKPQTGGIILNDERIVESTRLAVGDRLGLGTLTGVVKFEAMPELDSGGQTRTLVPEAFRRRSDLMVRLPEAFPGKSWSLDERGITLGANESNDIVLEDPYVSGFHARVYMQDGRAIIEDVGSRNGVFVGTQKVQSAEATPGAQIRVGQTVLLVAAEDPEQGKTRAGRQSSQMIGKSESVEKLRKVLRRVAGSDIPVLLTGETGTGKEVAASLVAQLSPRAGKPLIILNCGALTRDLVESELFGHEKGAFTGANERKIGAFEAANGGTLFLDEIGELPLDMQPKLLRALENSEVRRLGSPKSFHVDVRVIAATNRKLEEEVAAGRFREDLLHRMNIVTVELPPLRRRSSDIEELAMHFVAAFSPQGETVAVSKAALDKLKSHVWPGNIRELRNTLQRAVLMRMDDGVEEDDITFAPSSFEHRAVVSEAVTSRTLSEIEKEAITTELIRHKGNKKEAAAALGVSRSTIHRKIEDYGIDLEKLGVA